MIDLSHLWPVIDKGGLVAVLFFIVYGFARGWFVPRWVYDEKSQAHERMTAIAERAVDLSKRSATVAEVTVEKAKQ